MQLSKQGLPAVMLCPFVGVKVCLAHSQCIPCWKPFLELLLWSLSLRWSSLWISNLISRRHILAHPYWILDTAPNEGFRLLIRPHYPLWALLWTSQFKNHAVPHKQQRVLNSWTLLASLLGSKASKKGFLIAKNFGRQRFLSQGLFYSDQHDIEVWQFSPWHQRMRASHSHDLQWKRRSHP